MTTTQPQQTELLEKPRETIFDAVAVDEHHVLMRMEAIKLIHKDEIPEEMLEPLLGGELKEEVLDKALINPGDALLVQGGTVVKMIFGVYVVDTRTGLASENLRADLDLITFQPGVTERLANACKIVGSGYTTKKLETPHVEVGYDDMERLRQLDLETLEDLSAWVETLEPGGKQDWYAKGIEEVRTLLTNGKRDDFMEAHHLVPTESLSVYVTRGEDNKLHGYFLDGAAMLYDPIVKWSVQSNEFGHEYCGVSYSGPNISVRHLMLNAMQDMQETPFRNIEPYWTLQNITRTLIKFPSEQYVEMYEKDDAFYSVMWNVMRRVANGEQIFKITDEVLKDINTREWMADNVQHAFARGCAANGTFACTRVLAELPAATFLSPKLGQYFEPLYDKPTSKRGAQLANVTEDTLEAPPEQEEQLKTIVKLNTAIRQQYGAKQILLESHDPRERLFHANQQQFTEYERSPKNMSEIYAMLFWAMELDPEKDADLMHEIVGDWKCGGSLKATWKRQEIDFDTGLDEDLIRKYMSKLNEGKLISEDA